MTKVTYVPKPRYENPLAGQLGLGLDDLQREGKLARLLEDLQSRTRIPINNEVQWHFAEAEASGPLPLPRDWRHWPVLTSRSVWGTTQKHTWLVTEICVPEAARGKTLVINVASQWRQQQGSTDPQCLAYLDGNIAQALDGNHTELVISDAAVPGNVHLVQVNAFTFDERPQLGFHTEMALREVRVERLFHDLATAFEVAIRLPQSDAQRHALLLQIEQALYSLDRREGQTELFRDSLPEAERIASDIQTIPGDRSQPVITAFGHTHLDVAWLWQVKHVRDKAARSFATALNLMDEFPEFVFMYNQAVLFHFLKQDYPELWQRVKDKVRSGQFEVDGAMWVEPDVNISSGEALVRQIMRGQQFHQDEFGIIPKCVWLPDTFGYSAALPQILAKSGIEFFVTSKLSWNDTNRQPYDSFFWRGIDGSTVKAQLITTQESEATHFKTVYNSAFTVSDILGTWKRYEPKAQHNEVMICFGHGDGGGGPTRDMVQRGIRLQQGVPGAPRLRLEGLRPYLDRLGKKMDSRADAFPTWNGELYLQYHRGTLTSVAKNKANNRYAERAMRELEFAASMAFILKARDYPADTLRALWDIVLINQFHDILPGTSIAAVYDDTDKEYAELFAALQSTQGPMQLALDACCPAQADQLTLINFTGQCRDNELVEIHADKVAGAKAIRTHSGSSPLQPIVRADGSHHVLARITDIPSMGWINACYDRVGDTPAAGLSVSTRHLENEFVSISFDLNGEITSIIDKACKRELLQAGKTANQLIVYEDKPKNYDAWDIDHYFEEKFWLLSASPATIDVVETGPHRAAVRIQRQYASSRVVQVISLQQGRKQLEFDTEIDWQERQSLLKTSFPFDLNTTETRAEIQFGHVKRPSHQNTSWDQARFETCMHRWVDMSEPDFGAALLTDCKYGYDAIEQTLRLTLLKGPIIPDPDADIGIHHFRYALLLHQGEQDLSQVVQAATCFNNPVMVRGQLGDTPDYATQTQPDDTPDHLPTRGFSFASIDNENLTLETVKLAETGEAIVLRIFEHANRRGRGRLQFSLPVIQVTETNLMEQGSAAPITIKDNAVELCFRPFEIKTLKIKFA